MMHGFCASRPGMTMPNILSRRLNREVINMGVNGSALCESSVAKSVRLVDNFKNSGDKNIYFWDGEDFTNEYEDISFDNHSAGNECTVDVQHKSDLEFWLMANGVMRRIKELNI